MNTLLDKTYLSHLLTAKNRHGIHSPFVYKLLDEVIYDPSPAFVFKAIKKRRSLLLQDARFITIKGRKQSSGNILSTNKQLKVFYKKIINSPRWDQLIYRLTAWVQPTYILDIGSNLGIRASSLAKAAPKGKIYCLETEPAFSLITEETFRELNIKNYKLLTGAIDDILPNVIETIPVCDLIHFNSHHLNETLFNHFKLCVTKINENSLFIVEGIHRSAEINLAWQEIKAHSSVSLTMDLFSIGLVFFRSGQAKEHFRIRY